MKRPKRSAASEVTRLAGEDWTDAQKAKIAIRLRLVMQRFSPAPATMAKNHGATEASVRAWLVSGNASDLRKDLTTLGWSRLLSREGLKQPSSQNPGGLKAKKK